MAQTMQKSAVFAGGHHMTSVMNKVWAGAPNNVKARITRLRNGDRCPNVTAVYLLSSLSDLNEWLPSSPIPIEPHRKFLLINPGLPDQSIPALLAKLHVRDERRVHLAKVDAGREKEYLSRFLQTLSVADAETAILDAWWEGDTLVVISPKFDRLRVPLSSLPKKLQSCSKTKRSNFEVDEFGDFLYWPDPDVHMGWSQFEQAVNPQARLRARQESTEFNKRYGGAIRGLREEKGLRQSGIKGLDERTIRRIEQGRTRATANAIAKLAKAHGLAPNDYMSEVASRLAGDQ